MNVEVVSILVWYSRAHHIFLSQNGWCLGTSGKRCHAVCRTELSSCLALSRRAAVCRRKATILWGGGGTALGSPRSISSPQKTKADLFSIFCLHWFWPLLPPFSSFSILIPHSTPSYLLTKQKQSMCIAEVLNWGVQRVIGLVCKVLESRVTLGLVFLWSEKYKPRLPPSILIGSLSFLF